MLHYYTCSIREAGTEMTDKLSLHYLQLKALTVWIYLILKVANV